MKETKTYYHENSFLDSPENQKDKLNLIVLYAKNCQSPLSNKLVSNAKQIICIDGGANSYYKTTQRSIGR